MNPTNKPHNSTSGNPQSQDFKLFKEEAEFIKNVEKIADIDLPIIKEENFKKNGFGIVLKDGKIQRLGLANKNIKNLPENIDVLTELRTLNLAGNRIESLPKSMVNLKNLKELNITENPIKNFPEIIEHLNSVKYVWIFDSKYSIETSKSQGKSNRKRKTSKVSLFEELGLSSPKKSEKKQVKIYRCKKCNANLTKLNKIELLLMRRSPRRLVYEIKKAIFQCNKCNQIQSVSISRSEISLLKNIKWVEPLRNAIYQDLNNHNWCRICNKYYENEQICPIHKNELELPRLVFIRGLNIQYSSSKILKNYSKE
ncbi:MAG: leucine-rich repeat domain-containing protein [Promethearchaeota archaeon]|nr:MAG: leucine-rich repeat domain-containing protein [Candidatus Lokiarchaeota archaeon]